MVTHEATFEISSKTDAYAVEKLLKQLHDVLREETRTVRDGTSDSTQMLEQFATLTDVARNPTPGTLTVVYEQEDGPFEE